MAQGAVAAGHPATAEAGAWALRKGGNAVDAAVAAVCASFAAESPLTGLGAGGYMLVRLPGDEPLLLDFFVVAPGLGSLRRRSELKPVLVDFGGSKQTFNVGAASCGVPGVPAGLCEAVGRWGSMSLAELVGPACKLASEGVVINNQQAYLMKLLEPILSLEPGGRNIYSTPTGRLHREGERFRVPDLGVSLKLLAREGPEPFYRGEIAERICTTVAAGGGALAPEDLAAYEPIARDPVGARFAGREVLTNPPPASGGILIAFALAVLEHVGASSTEALVAAMEQAQLARTEEFLTGLYEPELGDRFLAPAAIAEAAGAVKAALGASAVRPEPGEQLGSTTHVTAVDAEGGCASVTCSNGAGSGIIVPGTGIHLNDMLGEEDLSPFGFHATPAGLRMPSMMSPTIVLRDGEFEVGLGSAGSNRIRSAITQTILRIVVEGMDAEAAVAAPRLHLEAGTVHAEPGIDDEALDALGARGYGINRFPAPNVFFGGVQAIVRDPASGALSGGGDPRRGGAVVMV